MNKTKEFNPRYVSFSVMNTYFQRKSDLKKLIDRHFDISGLTDLNKRFAYDIIKGTVRYCLKIDYIITFFSGRNLDKIDFPVLNILRTAVYQLLYMERVPPHAIVNESVALAKKCCSISSSKFINAVLRKISVIDNLDDYADLKINENIKDIYEKISIQYSFPIWLVKYFSSMYSADITEKICSAFNIEPSIFIRVNKLKTTKENLINLFCKQGLIQGEDFVTFDKTIAQKEIFSDTLILKKRYNIKNIEGYKQGYFYIQDYSSQIAVKYFLKPQKGENILDICGAPGGKATYMSELTEDQCSITSVDLNIYKLKIFEENIKRLGIKNITLLSADAQDLQISNKSNYFDKIFIDSPCSAFGTISKNPDAKYNRGLKDLKRLSEISQKILSGCLSLLKPHGVIVYYTCTLSNVENQDMIKEFIGQNNTKCKIMPISEPSSIGMYLIENNIISGKQPALFYEILPYYFKSEGGFVSIIEKF